MDARRRSNTLKSARILVLLLAVFFVRSQSSITSAEEPASQEAKSHARELSEAFRSAARTVLPSVVTVESKSEPVVQRNRQRRSVPDELRRGIPDELKGTPFEELFRNHGLEGFDEMPQEPRQGLGSGVIIDPSGIILTNNHVVAGDGKVRVRLSDGREFDAEKVKTDPRTDLAVVWIKGAGTLKAAKLGNSDRMEIGDWVLAVGNPFGLFESVTAGIISAKGRGIGVAEREEFLQTDAAINPGNSGGPLINLDGEVIGINTAISSRTGGYQGAGFAIPSNLARWVSGQLIENGNVRRAYLGTVIQPVTQELAERFGVKVGAGVLIVEQVPGSPAEEAGVKQGDIVIRFGGKDVSTPRSLQSAVETAEIGSKQPIEVIRDGKRLTLQVTVRQQPDDYGRESFGRAPQPSQSERARNESLGLEVGPLTDEVASQLGLDSSDGVVITQVERGSPAAAAGLSEGMAITQVNRKPVKSVEEFQAALEKESPKSGALLLVRTEEGSRFVVIRNG